MGEASFSEVSESLPAEGPLRWKLSEAELRAMPQEERDIYLNEKLSRVYDALMLQIEGSQSNGEVEVRPEDLLVILHPEKKDEYERLRDRDLPEH